jgi:two-component system, chemotaxis family, sensor kinase CheA
LGEQPPTEQMLLLEFTSIRPTGDDKVAEMEYAVIFREEAMELLEELETSLLALEKSPDDLKLVGRVFRAMHTIKGSGAMFGFDEIADFTHHVETVLDRVRCGLMPVTKALIDLVLAARDHIRMLLETVAGGIVAESRRGEEIIVALKALAGNGPENAVAGSDNSPAAADDEPQSAIAWSKDAEEGILTHFRIRFKPGPAFADSGLREEDIFKELERLGECSVFHTGAMQPAESCQPVWDILLTTDAGLNAVRDSFIFVEHISEVSIVTLAEKVDCSGFPEHKRLGDILVERGDVKPEDVQRVLAMQKPIGELLVDAKLVSRSQVESALAEQQVFKHRHTAGSRGSIRVPSEKLDKLINLVGEMVVTQARLTQVSAGLQHSDFLDPVEEVERLTAELRDCVLNIRMLPIGTTFGKFSRLVRDLSAELHKEIDLITEGAETELDKTVIEQLGDPLIHLIRNCIDHGIESPEERQAAGKPRRGYIRLAAVHSGAKVIISVRDDGKGIDVEKIKSRARSLGLLDPSAEFGEKEMLSLIFAPGFSTAEKVTSVSGRGVGMDVVRIAVEGLKGTVEVASVVGKGTVFTVTLPLTLAIIDGLLVRAGDTHFVLPLNAVEECVELTSKERQRFHGRRMLPVREQLVPYVRLRDFFGMEGTRPEREQMVVVQMDDQRIGLVLDTVIGGHQTVIKSLGWIYRDAEGLSGSTILGSGEVALIIDVPRLIQHAKSEEMATVSGRVH